MAGGIYSKLRTEDLCEKCLLLLEAIGKDLRDICEEEEQMQIQEINIFSNQDSWLNIIDVDQGDLLSTSLEESLTMMPNSETLISPLILQFNQPETRP